MSQSFELQVEVRDQFGKRASRRMRRETSFIPGTVYGAGADNVALTLNHNQIAIALENEAFYSHILTLHVKEGEKTKQEKVILKAVQRHPFKPKIMHVDFLRVSDKQKLHMQVPLHFINEAKCPGVKAGGIISHALNEVEIACLPADLPEFIDVDLVSLELNQTVHLSEIKLPKGVEIPQLAHGHDLPIVTIHRPGAEVEETVTPAADAVPTVESTKDKEKEKGSKDSSSKS